MSVCHFPCSLSEFQFCYVVFNSPDEHCRCPLFRCLDNRCWRRTKQKTMIPKLFCVPCLLAIICVHGFIRSFSVLVNMLAGLLVRFRHFAYAYAHAYAHAYANAYAYA